MDKWPKTHVRTVTLHLPIVGTKWRDETGKKVQVFSNHLGGVQYIQLEEHGVGASAIKYFLERFTPVTDDV